MSLGDDPRFRDIKVYLVAHNAPCVNDTPLINAVLAIKTSMGKAHERGVGYYIYNYDRGRVGEWMIEAARGFPSVLEHVVFTFFIDGITRVCSHQLVRHRMMSVTQESQRYTESRIVRCLECIYSVYVNKWVEDAYFYHGEVWGRETEFYMAEHSVEYDVWMTYLEALKALIHRYLDPEQVHHCLDEAFNVELCGGVNTVVQSLMDYVYARIEGREPEDARYLLPQCARTSMLITVNLRELLHIAKLRLSDRAQDEIRYVVAKMLDEVRKVVPMIDDLVVVCDDR